LHRIRTGKVLACLYNEESWKKSLETGEVHYGAVKEASSGTKGTSGNVQKIKEIYSRL
jgi:phosphoribosyl-AMP cyclohydrolase